MTAEDLRSQKKAQRIRMRFLTGSEEIVKGNGPMVSHMPSRHTQRMYKQSLLDYFIISEKMENAEFQLEIKFTRWRPIVLYELT